MNTSLPSVFLLVACLFVMRGGSPLQAGTLAENPPSEMTTVKGHAHDRHYLKSVGPGEPPHTHAVAPIRFPQIAEIAMSPSKVPAPAAQRSSQTMRFHLEAKEGVSFLADGTSYLYWTFNAAVPGPMLRVQVGDTVELTLENSGDYVLLDHAISRIDRGAYGILHVEGTSVPELLSPSGK